MIMNIEKIDELMQNMTLEEKVSLIHGNGLFKTGEIERLGIPALIMSDGPMGVRKEYLNDKWEDVGYSDDYVTYLPSNSALAATWNKELAYNSGYILGNEARGRGKDVILAPGINIMRSPLCGRNFEYMSEDPCLIKEMAVPFIKGVQENDVAACVKHFAVNNQETERMEVSVEIDERPLREIYLPGFEAAVKDADSYTIMSAYNKLRGEYCSHSDYLLREILHEQWGYNGVVISDWGAVHDTVEASTSRLDIEMNVTSNFNEYLMANPLIGAVREGKVEESVIDEKVKRILILMNKLNMFSETRKKGEYNTVDNRQGALEVARESIVLLKNEDFVLPLNENKLKTILVIGENANRVHANGGGSAEIKALYEITPLMGLKMKLGGNTQVKYIKGYSSEKDADNSALFEEAIKEAQQAEAVVFFGGLNHDQDTEGLDRDDLKLPYNQDELISKLLVVNRNTVISILSGSPVGMTSWIDNAKAVVHSSYAGVEGGLALAEIILGYVNPSGKLPVTFPMLLEDCPAHKLGEFAGKVTARHDEGLFVGYRYFDSYNVEPLFPFGHGLSYTEFAYDNLQIDCKENENNISIKVNFNIKNIGQCPGAEVAQLYVQDIETSVVRPNKELKSFQKVYLLPGEVKQVSLELNKESLAFYNDKEKQWKVESGEFNLIVGSSSRDKRLEKKFLVEGTY